MKIKKKLFFLLLTLLIAYTLSVSGFSIQKNDVLNGDVIDQEQDRVDGYVWIGYGVWQQFVPSTRKDLTRVEVNVARLDYEHHPLILTVEQPLGNEITGVSVEYDVIPVNLPGWVVFDVPDVSLIEGYGYHIVLKSAGATNDFYWYGGWGNPYPPGTSSYHSDWDFCFRTYVSKPKILNYQNQQNIVEQIIQCFPLLRTVFNF
jgi:hypothetical protein